MRVLYPRSVSRARSSARTSMPLRATALRLERIDAGWLPPPPSPTETSLQLVRSLHRRRLQEQQQREDCTNAQPRPRTLLRVSRQPRSLLPRSLLRLRPSLRLPLSPWTSTLVTTTIGAAAQRESRRSRVALLPPLHELRPLPLLPRCPSAQTWLPPPLCRQESEELLLLAAQHTHPTPSLPPTTFNLLILRIWSLVLRTLLLQQADSALLRRIGMKALPAMRPPPHRLPSPTF